MEAYFLSDLHLNEMDERNSQKLLRFLTSLADRCSEQTSIFLLGDVFDLWLSNHEVFLKKWAPLLQALKKLKARGARIIYFEGNHDMHLAPYWRDQLGVEIYVCAKVFQLGPWRVRCEHGDEINRRDLAYLRLRAFVRHPFMEFLAHTLPGKFWNAVGKRLSHESRKHSSADRQRMEDDLRGLIREHARRSWDEDPFDLIVSGHMHVRDDWTFEKGERRVRSINLGSWFDETKILVLNETAAEWRNLE